MKPIPSKTDSAGEWQRAWLSKGIRVHVTAVVDEGARIGKGSTVWHFTHVRSTARIGKHCSIGHGCYVDATVGGSTKIANGVHVYRGVRLGRGVFVGPNTTFTNDLWPRATDANGFPIVFSNPAKTKVCDGASIGAGCVILPVKIGAGSMIAAGCVVTKDVPSRSRVLCAIELKTKHL